MPPATTRPLWQRFLIFLVPLMAANILQSLSGTLNNIYVGQLLGVGALAAVSVFFPIMILLIALVIGLASGSTVLIGQAWGARNLARVKQVTGTTLTVAFLMGLAVAAIGVPLTAQMMAVLGAPADILAMSTEYGRVMLLGMPGFFVFIVATSILRGVGDTVTPLIVLGISTLVGLVTTPALILGWLGLPRLGVTAAAVATIVGFLIALGFMGVVMRVRRHPLAPDKELFASLRIEPATLRLILKLGVPAAVQMVVSSLAAIVVVGLVNRFGSNATAAYGAVNQVLSYVQFPAMSMAIAASIFGAQAIGAGRADELGRITRTAQVMNLLITGGLVLLAYVFSERLVALFITSEEVIALTQELLHIVLWSVVLFGAASVLSGVMRASGVVFVPMVIALVAIVLVEVPVAIGLSRAIGLDGIWWAYALSFSFMFLAQLGYYQFRWKKKSVTALV